jgi:trehalose 6-phosphate phosphatase
MSLIYLFDAWEQFSQSVRNAGGLWLGTDYDGTLAPISDDPAEKTLSAETHEALKALLKIPALRISVISGRDLANLRERVGIPFLGYAGNHGLEFEWADEREEHPESDRFREVVQRLATELSEQTSQMPGVVIQDKGVSLTAHFKRAAHFKDPLKAIIEATLQPADDFKVRGSLTAWDVRPYTTWNKGTALRQLRRKQTSLAWPSVFLGDDRSDEDAFAVLSETDFGILVGEPRQTHAKYHLKSHHEVTEFLQRVKLLFSDSEQNP